MEALHCFTNGVLGRGEGDSMACHQVPVYHVCQLCGGEGCAACSDLMILDGDIQLDPEWDEEIPEPKETIQQRVARYNSGRNRLLAIKMLRDCLLNPDLYCPRCFQTKASYQATCTRASCEAAQ